eukprot:CAMPEP_0172619976 /NCGR_PEP_ID=MMETSP1068-20121228/98927_1 /TAXON_ID=35684 /ORGANISM="Pseudopedinella elastica, Strain CCMP716" /LENGTH=54 /DNA_ID=CAMNT_0013427017 /DNA_START=47 /DNA_END=208 /DNA_ORIENTATION=+
MRQFGSPVAEEAVDLENGLWANSQELSASVEYGYIKEIKAGQLQRRKFDMMVFY